MLSRSYILALLLGCAILVSFPLIQSSRSQGANHSILLDGASAYVDVLYDANLDITGALTIEAWMKTSSTAVQALAPFSSTTLAALIPPQGSSYAYRRTITIDHTKVPNTDQTNFPVLISGSYSYLATTANGGNVQNANDGRSRSLSYDRSTGGSFVGLNKGTVVTTRTETNAFDSKNLGQMLQQVGVGNGGPNSGATFNYYPQRNYVARDVASDIRNTDIGVFGVFIHETANAIGDLYGLADPYSGYGKQNARRGIVDPDVGAAFETCVFGGLVGLQSGRVGSSREFR